jgi:HAMP domain-containing protein
MATPNSIPQARVVRKAGQLLAPPPAPRTDEVGALETVLGYAIGNSGAP